VAPAAVNDESSEEIMINGGTTLRRLGIRGTLLTLAATLVLTGCGGSGSSSSSAAAATGSASPTSAQLSAFQTCLKQHGVTVRPGQFSPRPRASFTRTAFPTGSPRPRPSFTGSFAARDSAAFKACAKYAPAGFGGGFGRTISSSALAAFKSCLSQNGVKVTGTTANAILAELRNATGKTATAVRTCRVLLQPTAPSPSPSANG
jgi:hypothetical protein